VNGDDEQIMLAGAAGILGGYLGRYHICQTHLSIPHATLSIGSGNCPSAAFSKICVLNYTSLFGRRHVVIPTTGSRNDHGQLIT
jgi:hypothetical protein